MNIRPYQYFKSFISILVVTWFVTDYPQDFSYYSLSSTAWSNSSYNQSSTLLIEAAKTDKDRMFQCKVVGGALNISQNVILNVFGEFFF